jgi:tetratricopeptide (TPR) repeat protein
MDDCYIFLGDSWLAENELNKAVSYYLKAEEISSLEEDNAILAEIYSKLGRSYFLIGQYDLAEDYCYRCIELAMATNATIIESDAHSFLSGIYEAKGRMSESLKHFKIYSHLKDSIFNADKYRAIAEMEIKYETDKKEQEIALYKEQAAVQELMNLQKNRMLFVLAFSILMFLVIAYLLYKQNKLKTQRKAAELEQKLLRTQMNPHFIFNSLIAIQSYIYKNDAVLAGDYLARFA